MSFNIFGQPTPDDIKVGYISTTRGFIDGVSKNDANIYAKSNPGATFILKTRERIRYLNINEVNALTIEDLGGNQYDTCEGIQLDSECGPPRAFFYGGGGVGVQGNPIIGEDGAVLAVDLIHGGHGYQYAPLTEVKDGCGIGAGAVVRSVLGDVTEQLEIFDQESDFEDYIIKDTSTAGFGRRFDASGKDVGQWDPTLYASFTENPIRREINEYQDFLQTLTKPWWNTRKEQPLRITATDKVTTVIHQVTDKPYRAFQDQKAPGNLQATIDKGFVWNKFMNKFAVSPVPPSAAPGSDFATELFQMEWEEDFPYDGIYKFRGTADSAIKDVYIDNQKVMSCASFNEAPAKKSKFIKAGVHIIRIDLKNGGFYKEKVADAVAATAAVVENQKPGGIFLQEGSQYYYLIGGNDLVKIEFQFNWDDDAKDSGYLQEVTIDTEDGPLSFKRKGPNDEKGNIRKKGTFRNGKKYKVSFDHDSSTAGFRIVDTGPNPDQEKQRIEFDDNAKNGFDVNAQFTALTAENLSGGRVVKEATAAQSARFVTQPSKELFTTTDFIGRANRQLYRTNPSSAYRDNNFFNTFGVTPVNPNQPDARTESFAGSYEIVWRGVNFPDKTVYTFELMCDDFVTVTISGNNQEPIVIEKAGGGNSDKLTVAKSMEAGRYDITAVLEQSDAAGTLKGTNIGRVGDQDQNPMGIAMTILSSIADAYELEKRAWLDNPMGVSLAIDAPLPPIPQEPIPQQTGRCPNNPIWTTRYPTAAERWWPVTWSDSNDAPRPGYWTDFFDRYAISPVPPLSLPNTDAGGIPFTNSWPIDIPYDGFYKFAVQRDNIAKIFVDGRVAFDVKGSGDIKWKNFRGIPKFQSVFITKGMHTISLELTNFSSETFTYVDQKIFRSKDFQTPLETTTTTQDEVPPGGMFLKEGGSYFLLAGGNDLVEIDFVLDYDDDPGNAGIALDNLRLQSENGELFFDRKKKKEKGSVSLTGTFKSGNKYAITIGGRASGSKDPVIVDTGPNPDQFQQRINMFDGDGSDVNAKFTAITARQLSPNRTSESVSAGTVPPSSSGVTYSGPPIFHYKDDRWSRFMNNHSISPYLPPLGEPNSQINGVKDYTFSGVDFPESGQYEIYLQADNQAELFVNGVSVAESKSFRGTPIVQKANISKGKYDIVVRMENTPDFTDIFTSNPVGFALVILKKVKISNGSLSWVKNPVAISAILIPPPCPRLISGKGTIVDVLVDDPGNGFESPTNLVDTTQSSTYPVSLRLKSIEVEDPGINYNCGEDQIIIEPSNGAELSYSCDTFGRITNVDIVNPGLGFTKYPDIRMVGPDGAGSPTPGVNATFRPQFEVVRDPIVVDEAKLIQVTDLVGLKQTGYVDGRAYYGAVFYKDNIRYAGFYETPGDLVQVYDTLQESIDGEVTTPPSAIQRQGTDVTSNDPRLDIPNTPDDLIDID